ncbi:MAG: ABC transporter ATP-binding protein [Spirochaetia bacterium]|jgi:multiple sugar transport system ATP-binding protein|nr:ABC transporter ATP-binding protein [Spirochaetia bacterium]
MEKIELKKITKKYGKIAAVDNMDLSIKEGEFLTLLGPSGCGKTTTLRMIAGLEEPSSGELFSNGKTLFSKEAGVYVPPEQRNLGFMFQSYALWPHMTVRRNISLGLETRKIGKEKINKKVKDVLEKVQLTGYEGRYPSELSGGQQQRVALARMIAAESAVFLMDEPLSNLDAMLRVDMRFELKRLHKELNATSVYVTHDQVEALTLSDRIIVMNEGKVIQSATPEKLYLKPANLFVAKFVGSPRINLVEGGISSDGGTDYFKNSDVVIPLNKIPSDVDLRDKNIIAGIRAEDIGIKKIDSGEYRIYSVLPAGSETIMNVIKGETHITVKVSGFTTLAMDDQVELNFEKNKISFYNKETKTLIY